MTLLYYSVRFLIILLVLILASMLTFIDVNFGDMRLKKFCHFIRFVAPEASVCFYWFHGVLEFLGCFFQQDISKVGADLSDAEQV